MLGLIATQELSKKIKANNYNLKELLKNGEYDLLNEILGDYYSVQLEKHSRQFNLFIDVDWDILKIAIENKIKQGLYFDGYKILKVVESNFELDDDLKLFKKVCNYCHDLSENIFDDKDIKAVKSLVNGADDYCKNLIDTYRAEIYLKLCNSEYQNAIDFGEEILKEFPEDGEVLGLVARAYYNLDETEKAHEIYDRAVHLTRNGFIWRNAKQDIGIERMLEEANVN